MDTRARWREAFVEALADRDERRSFTKESLVTIPIQIRAMREARGWSQRDLARRMGVGQPVVSRLESLDDPLGLSINLLKRVARAFDVALTTRFDTFSAGIEHVLDMAEQPVAAAYDDDEGLRE